MMKKTEQQYLSISKNLAKRYLRETGIAWHLDPMSFCHWILSLTGSWSVATWRLRKSALYFFMKTHGTAEAADFFSSAKKIKKSEDAHTIKMTSQKKSKKITVPDLFLLIDTLEHQTNGKYDKFIAQWVMSGILVGIRPVEWYGARIEGNSLLVKNAKNSDDRACGDFRRIEFKKDKLDSLKTVREFVSELNGMNLTEVDFEQLYQYCRRRLRAINIKLWPDRKERICFYSARHQFSANAKASMDLIGVAALMGHRSTNTATRSYLHRRYGDKGMISVEPCEANIKLVNDDFKEFRPKSKKKDVTF